MLLPYTSRKSRFLILPLGLKVVFAYKNVHVCLNPGQSSKEITAKKFNESKIPANMHKYILHPSYLQKFMKFGRESFQRVLVTKVWWTDRQMNKAKTIPYRR